MKDNNIEQWDEMHEKNIANDDVKNNFLSFTLDNMKYKNYQEREKKKEREKKNLRKGEGEMS